jgi:hypothetical protein
MKNVTNIIGNIAEVLITELFFGKKEDKTPPVNNETIDLGYAVVVDDDGNEIKNY